MASLGVHPSLSAKHKFWKSRNANGSDSVTQNYPEVCQQGHRSVMGHNRLSLMKISSEPAVYSGWKAHHDWMCDDPDMLKWSCIWWSHNKQLHSTFMDCPFIIDPDSITYCHQFEHTRLDAWMNLPSCHSPRPHASHSSSTNDNCYMPYEKLDRLGG